MTMVLDIQFAHPKALDFRAVNPHCRKAEIVGSTFHDTSDYRTTSSLRSSYNIILTANRFRGYHTYRSSHCVSLHPRSIPCLAFATHGSFSIWAATRTLVGGVLLRLFVFIEGLRSRLGSPEGTPPPPA